MTFYITLNYFYRHWWVRKINKCLSTVTDIQYAFMFCQVNVMSESLPVTHIIINTCFGIFSSVIFREHYSEVILISYAVVSLET